jgi:hypothetical protein
MAFVRASSRLAAPERRTNSSRNCFLTASLPPRHKAIAAACYPLQDPPIWPPGWNAGTKSESGYYRSGMTRHELRHSKQAQRCNAAALPSPAMNSRRRILIFRGRGRFRRNGGGLAMTRRCQYQACCGGDVTIGVVAGAAISAPTIDAELERS